MAEFQLPRKALNNTEFEVYFHIMKLTELCFCVFKGNVSVRAVCCSLSNDYFFLYFFCFSCIDREG